MDTSVSGKPAVPGGNLPVPEQSRMLLLEEQYDIPDRGDPSLITVTERPDFRSARDGEPWFNGIENLQTRQVTISGVQVSWDGSIAVLEALRTTRDVTDLTVIADEVVIEGPVSWKGADITIIARQLIFRRGGCIITSPEGYGAPAFSAHQDDRGRPLLDPANPEASGTPTLSVKGKDGLPGCRAGNVTLRVLELELGDAKTLRFDCSGGDGQKGETGGYLDRPDGKPSNARTVSLDDIARAIKDSANSTPDINALKYWYYPHGGEKQPYGGLQSLTTDLYGKLVGRGFIKAGTVTHVRIIFIYLRFPVWHATCVDLPNYKRREHKDSSVADPNRPLPPPVYPSGTSGGGGAGGDLVVPDRLREKVAPSQFKGDGGMSPVSDPVEAKSGTPERYQVLSYVFWENLPPWVDKPPRSVVEYRIVQQTSEVGSGWLGRGGPRGADGAVCSASATEASWLDPRLLRVVLTYARRLAYMVHRDEAMGVLGPYYPALPKPGSAAVGSELATIAQGVHALIINMATNLDAYGNPGGWVPRFSAHSYFELYYGDRAFSYKFVYAIHKALALADSVENASKVLEIVASQNEAVIDQLHAEIGRAYAAYHDARDLLDLAVDRFNAVNNQLEHIKAQAELDAEEKKRTDAIITAVFNTAGAICSALPVGQPYLAGVGAVLTGIGKTVPTIDTSQPTYDQALGFLGGVSKHLEETLDDSKDTFKDQFDDRLKAKYKSKLDPETKDLKKQIEIGRRELAKAQQAADDLTQKTYAKVMSNSDLAKLLSTVEKDNQDLLELASDRVALKSKLDDANRLISALPSAGPGSTALAADLAAKQRQNLVAARAKLYAQIGALDSTVAEKRKQAAAASDSLDAKKNAVAGLEDIADARDQATKKKEALEKLLEELDNTTSAKADAESKATFATVLDSTQKMAKGLSDSAESIRAALRPVSADDQDVQALRDKLLKSRFKEEFNYALADLEKAKAARAEALQRLQDCNRRMLAGIADLNHALETSVALSRNRQALAVGIDAGVKVRMEAMAQSATERMDFYLYLVRKAYLYEQLAPVGKGLAQVNEFTTRFDRWLANNKNALSEKNVPESLDLTDAKGKLEAVEAIVGSDFQALGDLVLRETLAELTETILKRRQLFDVQKSNIYEVTLPSTLRDVLLTPDGLHLNHIAQLFTPTDAGSFLSRHKRVRVADIGLKFFEVEFGDGPPNDSIRLELTIGRTFPLRGDDGPDGKPRWYLFRLSDREEPMTYGFVLNDFAEVRDGVWSGTVSVDTRISSDDFFEAIMSKGIDTAVKYTDMSPSLVSSLGLNLVMGADHIKAIHKATLQFTLKYDG